MGGSSVEAIHLPDRIFVTKAYNVRYLTEDLFLQISDEGGGIPRSGLPKIWTYLYSTAKNPVVLGRQDQEMPNVMAGYGYGLPISRCYARYFGGDVQIISMEGYGKCFLQNSLSIVCLKFSLILETVQKLSLLFFHFCISMLCVPYQFHHFTNKSGISCRDRCIFTSQQVRERAGAFSLVLILIGFRRFTRPLDSFQIFQM